MGHNLIQEIPAEFSQLVHLEKVPQPEIYTQYLYYFSLYFQAINLNLLIL